jgi:hypothetical protein
MKEKRVSSLHTEDGHVKEYEEEGKRETKISPQCCTIRIPGTTH